MDINVIHIPMATTIRPITLIKDIVSLKNIYPNNNVTKIRLGSTKPTTKLASYLLNK